MKYLRLLLLLTALAGSATASQNKEAGTYRVGMYTFIQDFVPFAKYHNQYISDRDAVRQAKAIWVGAWCNPARARRIACLGVQESRYRLLAYVPDANKSDPHPRTDALGMHYDFLLQALRDYGLVSKTVPAFARGGRHNREWIEWKRFMVVRPDLGTLLGALKFSKLSQGRWGSAGAIRQWKTGKPYYTEAGQSHLDLVLKLENRFEKMSSDRKTREGAVKIKTMEVIDEEVAFSPDGALSFLGLDAPAVPRGLFGTSR